MAQQPSYAPYEQPEQMPSSGTVGVDEPVSFRLLAERGELKNPVPRTAATVGAGRTNYGYFCIQCHGLNLDGDSTVGPSFPGGNMSLLAAPIMKQSDEQLFLTTWYGKGMHPPLGGTLTADEAWSVIAYVRSAQANPPKGARPEGFPPAPVEAAPLSK
jgi:mono/diheme cytochrome c family protein